MAVHEVVFAIKSTIGILLYYPSERLVKTASISCDVGHFREKTADCISFWPGKKERDIPTRQNC
jgi:hypothetical protein